jgi:glycosyltransferase involved in cell wall biosynthesis
MEDKKVAIIIVNWNGGKYLKNCLYAVFNQTYKDFDIYFVDNGSIDNSIMIQLWIKIG